MVSDKKFSLQDHAELSGFFSGLIWDFLSQISLIFGLFIGVGLIVFAIWRSNKSESLPNWWDASYLIAGVILLIATQFSHLKIGNFEANKNNNNKSTQQSLINSDITRRIDGLDSKLNNFNQTTRGEN